MASTQVFSAVLRRYSDFLWLYEKLQMERAGAIVPQLPEKQPVGRFNPAFVEIRRRELERFLRRVAVHPELQGCASFDAFLRADDVTFQAAKHSKVGNGMMMQQPGMMGMANNMMMPPQPQVSPTKKEGFKRWFAETKTSISGDLVSILSKIPPVHLDQAAKFFRNYIFYAKTLFSHTRRPSFS